MASRLITIICAILISSCSSFGPYDLPVAYLVVDGNKYEMVSGTYCWDHPEFNGFCSDSFANVTQISPIQINSESRLELFLESGSKLTSLYVEKIDTKYYSPTKLSIEDDRDYSESFNSKYIIWEQKPEYEEYLQAVEESQQIELKPSLKQGINNDFSSGEHIVSVGSWWAGGDIFFDILIQKKP